MYASRTTQFIVGIFGVIGIVAMCVLAFELGKIPLVAPKTYTLYAMFDNVSGLNVNDAVQIAGVKVGKVVSITLSQKTERARVATAINQGVAVDDDAIASIKTSGIIGSKYIAISMGAGETLKDAGTIVKTESSFVLEDAIAQLMGNSSKGAGIGGGGGSGGGDNNPNSSSASATQKPANGGELNLPPGAGNAKSPSKSDSKGK